ncbi:nicotinate (nicotinamide) nucleotide adenylyltransferase [Moraxella catarrhalis]|uniref:Probable nicotinate-nucleotide adenylyltransferase n=1 Tax=Moraxella catarrhalis TaxID=480 RepID=A0A198UN70_MORCA|nr:nicotinate (nicotinamide) nucleotide adenylyltransferase [Moraxella catarrhalis]OAU96265.1 Nicotinate-nucleotide adenylyltransferase bacterial NadD family [Moraxella catarrhalis]OAU97630.1 Nicotinate-nucleotide adenylyltransferase bacterial NadD family [Moraxella catarrhalis]OAU97796.1 Nicotinate-nucleotide adenylyltransferase bacterial NadD family [Moraxella catarrhalis]
MTHRIYLGGSFDPIHRAHLQMVLSAHDAIRQKTADKVYLHLLPTAGNPFKGAPTSHAHRIAMLKLAIAPLIRQGMDVSIDERELSLTPPVYTIDTIRQLKTAYPDDSLIFIIGGDSLANLHRWKAYDELIYQVKLWAFDRADTTPTDETVATKCTTDLDEFLANDKTIYLDPTPILNISSSQIRALIADGHPKLAAPLLDERVLAYIHEEGLYQSPKNML